MSIFQQTPVSETKTNRASPIPQRRWWETLKYTRYALYLLCEKPVKGIMPHQIPAIRDRMQHLDDLIAQDKRSKREDGPVIEYGKNVVRNMIRSCGDDMQAFQAYTFDSNMIPDKTIRDHAVNAYRYTHQRAADATNATMRFFDQAVAGYEPPAPAPTPEYKQSYFAGFEPNPECIVIHSRMWTDPRERISRNRRVRTRY